MDIIAESTLRMGKPGAYVFIDPGQSVSVGKEEGKRLIERGFARADTSEALPEDNLTEAIVDAIGDLSSEAFGKDGKPNVKALEDIIGQTISAADRDKAWSAYQALVDNER